MKKFFAAYLLIASALVTSSSFFFVGGSVKAKAAAAAQGAGITLPNAAIYALNNDNVIFVMTPGSTSFTRLGRLGPNQVKGNLIGLDFRPADGSSTSVYGLTDSGNLYLINLASSPPTAALVSSLSPRFAGGVQSLMDFNPVVNALRLIGGNDQNFALVNSNGGNLNATAVQTKMSYDPKDVNAGLDPNIAAGAYTNNYAGAPNTLFYGVDFDLDTFVTISSVNATGSSNTGGGLLQTIGPVIDQTGAPINFSPIADIDIFTDANGVNSLVGMSGRTMFTIDLSQINPSLQLGTTQRVIARTVNMAEPGGGYIDIAIAPAAAAPAPAPAPSPTPTPAPTQSPISPIVECVSDSGGGKFTAQFGYSNPNANTITIPLGDNNKLIPTPPGAKPTSTFLPGRQRNVFSVASGGGNVVWALNGKTATASLNFQTRCTQ